MMPLIRPAGPADWPAVRQCMREVFAENPGQKTGDFTDALWSWQYEQIPGGSLVLLAELDGTVAGYYHALFETLTYEGVPVVAGMVQDVATKAVHRKLGIFKQVGGVALEEMRQKGVEFIYTFPNHRSLPSFIRNHAYSVVTQVPVLLLPLKLGPLARGRVQDKAPALAGLAGLAGSVIQPFYRGWMTRTLHLQHGEQIERLTEATEEMERLAAHLTSQTAISLRRDRQYLQWRFFDKPTQEYEIWGLRKAGALEAFVVTRTAEILGSRCLMLMDFGYDRGQEQAVCRLASERIHAAEKSGHALSLAMGLHPVFSALRQLGFRRVPERFDPRVFSLVAKQVSNVPRPLLFEERNWTISLADWDVY